MPKRKESQASSPPEFKIFNERNQHIGTIKGTNPDDAYFETKSSLGMRSIKLTNLIKKIKYALN